MLIPEGLITNIISSILDFTTGRTWKSLTRREKVLKIFDHAGLKPGAPDPTFESVYAHALVEYGVAQTQEPILNFFQRKDIQGAFKRSFERNDFSILNHEAAAHVNWSTIGEELRFEFEKFTPIFHEMVDRTRTPAEVRREGKLDEILRMVKDGDLKAIRETNLEMMRGPLADRLKSWFNTLGYGMGTLDVRADDYYEWIITIPARRGYDRILVRCIERQAEALDLEGVEADVEQHGVDEGWLVAPHRISLSAKKKAGEVDGLFCFTFDELLDEQADFRRYFNWLAKFVNKRGIDKDYIPLACKRDVYKRTSGEKTGEERYGEAEGWIEGYIDRWLEDPCKEHISILGEFGTGKTWFNHNYAFQLMQKYMKAKDKGLSRPRLPLVIQLRDYSKALNIESLFSDFFFRRHEIPLAGYSAFEQLNRMGKLLLIFDGFDEMADKLDRQKMINNFWEIARVIVPGAKAILTCRTEHFPNARESRDLLNAELKASTSTLTGERPQFEVLNLERFDEEQIRKVLSKRTDSGVVDLIMGHPELLDIASRPVMLEFVLEALPDIEAGSRVDLARIYLYAIRTKLDRDIKSERTFTSMADKLYFMCELSWEMLTSEKMSLNYRMFPERLANLFGPVVSEEKNLDHWQYDMMGNSLLIRNDDGDYSPAHRSLTEFFAAYKAIAEIGMLSPDFIEPARSQSNIDRRLPPKNYPWSAYFTRKKNEDGTIRKIPPLNSFLPGNVEEALSLISGQGDTVYRFIHEMINTDEAQLKFNELLSDVLEEFKQGRRDPETQQELLGFILKFRRLSQEWEELADRGDSIRCFWKDRLLEEISVVKDKCASETMLWEIPGTGSIRVHMVQVPKGSFFMGDEIIGPIHLVKIEKPFQIAEVPVTQTLYNLVIGRNPSLFKKDDAPVERVTWFDAVRFCNELSKRMNLEPAYKIEGKSVEWLQGSIGFRLPTETEWEYACRAGTTTRFATGDLETDLDEMGWWIRNSGGRPQPVAQKKSNAWGVFDMHGNVWEWLWDWYRKPSGISVNSPAKPSEGTRRVRRGGSWYFGARDCRSGFSHEASPGSSNINLGFRLSRSLPLGPFTLAHLSRGSERRGGAE